ncbi:MAG TPA: malto-oligosyltrehalose synthase, partial [Spirochaetia bacterium]|nr:malto-oligosyltrehalose synthase [Spirochaetia bacterium]
MGAAGQRTGRRALYRHYRMRIPRAVYRIQFTPDFTFSDCADLVPYLSALGVSDIYASPVFSARPESSHGYDVTDPRIINPKLGGEEAFRDLLVRVRAAGMGWLQDIVPNHMAFHPDNSFLRDIFRRGPDSFFYRFFDIDWEAETSWGKGRVLAPFLGDNLQAVLDRNELVFVWTEDGFAVTYADRTWPLSFVSYPLILSLHPDTARPAQARFSAADGDALMKRMAKDNTTAGAVHTSLARLNAAGDQARSLRESVLAAQYFRLSHWERSRREINYRRFFSVNELIALRAEDRVVFEISHA